MFQCQSWRKHLHFSIGRHVADQCGEARKRQWAGASFGDQRLQVEIAIDRLVFLRRRQFVPVVCSGRERAVHVLVNGQWLLHKLRPVAQVRP